LKAFTAIEGSMTDAQPHADGKWVEGLTAETSAGKAARRTIGARLATVREALAFAGEWGPDPEPVHHLRVATRRATAALDAFRDLLPGRAYRKARKRLKRLRRAAAAARDADVFLDGVRVWAVHQSPADRPGLHFLLGHGFAQRQAAQSDLTCTVRAWQAGICEQISDLPDKVRTGKRELLGDRAEPVLAALLADLATAVSGDLDDYPQLHRVRILAKRLRYALELFVDCFPPAAREQVYPRVEAVQEILGQANDSHQVIRRLDGLLDAVGATQPPVRDLIRGGVEELRAHHRQRLREQRAAFADWWRGWQLLRPAALLTWVMAPATPAAGTETPVRSSTGL
jgi:CHAD domain-containing protein